MNHTTNLHLPQWEETDRILRNDFNDAFAAIDAAVKAAAESKPKIVIGTYTGEAQNLNSGNYRAQNITLGFRPKLLMIVSDMIYSTEPAVILFGEMQVVRDNYVFAQITDTGFLVGTRANGSEFISPDLNNASKSYGYIAVG